MVLVHFSDRLDSVFQVGVPRSRVQVPGIGTRSSEFQDRQSEIHGFGVGVLGSEFGELSSESQVQCSGCGVEAKHSGFSCHAERQDP